MVGFKLVRQTACAVKKLQKILGQGTEAQITSHQHQKFYFFFDQKNYTANKTRDSNLTKYGVL